MADEPNHQIQLDRPPVLQQRWSRAPKVLISVAALAIIAAASAYLWLNYDSLFQAASSTAHPAATPVVASGEETVTLRDFQSFQRQTAETLQSTIQAIDAQKADLKSLSDQVSALAAKIDALQSAAQSTGSLSAPVEVRPVPQEPAVPARPPVIAARKKPLAPKTTGPISVGGAPLPPAPSGGR